MSRASATVERENLLTAVTIMARWLVGGLFIYMGLSKALHPVEFLKLVRQYDMVQSPLLLNVIASTLPWFEVFCGLLLVSGIAVRGTALLSLSMLVPFTWIVLQRALALQTASGLAFCAIRFDCGCGAGEVLICHKLVENGVLIVLSVLLLVWRCPRLCVKYDLVRTGVLVES